MNNNWNKINGSILVQDTCPPDQPILLISPVGSVSGLIVFDWREGSDESGISYYILIIDDESNPETTQGYVLMANITNNNPESSYFELPTNLTQGTYYYFLAQVDGAGHQSDYTTGSFILVLSNGGGNPFDSNMIYFIIIGIALTSIIGITITSIIIKRRIKSKVLPERKKIPINEIIFHINQISKSIRSLKMEKVPKVPKKSSMKSEESIKNENLVLKLDEIKKLGQELFEEGAYFEAQKQFKYGKELSIELGKGEEAQLFTDLISGIEGLVEEREKRLEQLNQEKMEGSTVRIFDSYYTLVEISKKLRDLDSAKMYLSELIQTFQTSNLSLSDLYEFQSLLNRRAQSLEDDNYYKKAAEVYEKCKKISQLLAQLGREGENIKVDDFEKKINQCLKNIEK
jgi:tetratricopeptide (TPR) repeat protein